MIKGEELGKKFLNREDRYFLINIIAKRSRSLIDGDKPRVDPGKTIRTSEIAIREILDGKIKVIPRKTRTRLVDVIRQSSDKS